MVVPIVSLKGGVGKSTVSINLADVLANEHKTLLIDTDQQNSVASLFCKRFKKGFAEVMFDRADVNDVIYKINEDNELYIIPTGMFAIEQPIVYEDEFNSKKLKYVINELKRKFDFIIFDTSPRISKPVVSILENCDFYIIVITPDPASVASLKIFLDTIKEKNISDRYSIIVNNMQPDQLAEDFYAFIQAISRNNIIGTLPRDEVVLESSGECTSVNHYDNSSAFAKNMEKIAHNLKSKLEELSDENGFVGSEW